MAVSTGRFAKALGIPIGLDPAPAMLAIAASRGTRTALGAAENQRVSAGIGQALRAFCGQR